MIVKGELKKRIYWIIVAILIVVIPFVAYFGYQNFPTKDYSSKVIEKKYTVPLIAEQPSDTLVTNKVIPIHSWKTKEGVNVVFVPTEKLPMVDIDVSFHAGSARDGNSYGLAYLTSKLLDQGIKDIPDNPYKIASVFENAGAIYSSHVGRDRARVTLRTLAHSKKVNKVIDLFAKVIATPTFDQENVIREKENLSIALNYNEFQPDDLGDKEFYKTIYGKHPYAHSVLGELDTVKKITKDDIHNFYSKYYVAKNSVITIVGGIHRDRARDIANKISSMLPEGKKAKALPDIEKINKHIEREVKHPSDQSYILLGQLGAARADKDIIPLAVGNHILGGGLVSRLFKRVRIHKGYAYHVSSNLIPGEKEGPFVAILQTRGLLTSKAITLVKKVIKEFIAEGPRKSELKKAKKHLIGAFPLRFEDNSKVLEFVSPLAFYDLPLNYYDSYVESIDNLTANEVKNVMQKRLNVDKMTQVIVGEK